MANNTMWLNIRFIIIRNTKEESLDAKQEQTIWFSAICGRIIMQEL